jgi:DNA-binding NtrC family response regulator
MTTPRPLHFLLVDDDPLILMSLNDLIQDMGHATAEASHADAALAHLSGGHTVDVLLTDIKLPTMSGYELAQQARHMLPGLRVIFATGYDSKRIGDAARDPAIRFLQKPFGQKELDDALSSMGLIETAQR